MTLDLADRTVGDLVSEDYRRASVFKQFGLDFCCGGGRPLRDACARQQVDLDAVIDALLAADARASRAPEPAERWEPARLADHIEREHHGYVRETLPVLKAFTGKVARVHGRAHPELVEIAAIVDEIAAEMEAHMVVEEQAAFPRIRALAGASGDGGPSPQELADLALLITTMESEHDRVGELMRRIRVLSADFAPPEYACATYRAAFVKLEEFEGDLHRHVHLENNVLFPAALSMSTVPAES